MRKQVDLEDILGVPRATPVLRVQTSGIPATSVARLKGTGVICESVLMKAAMACYFQRRDRGTHSWW